MKTSILVGLACAFLASRAMGDTISFVDTIAGVDNSTGFSTDGNVTKLSGQSLSLLGGRATVTGFQIPNLSTDPTAVFLSHTGTRGLGVWDGDGSSFPVEQDEIDNITGPEWIEINFNGQYAINSLEVRSLFFSDSSHPNFDYLGNKTDPEQAVIDFYKNGALTPFFSQTLIGKDFLGTDDGDQEVTFGVPIIADRLVFRVPTTLNPTGPTDPDFFMDFAVAKLDVTAVPLPSAALSVVPMGLLALVYLALKRRQRLGAS